MKKAKKSRVKAAKRTAGRSARSHAVADHVHADDGVDGCELDFNEVEATPDDALPAAMGGVAAMGRSRSRRPSARQ
jgi:hypothetical protein